MTEYRPTIGLEIHAELKTRTKMFCACANNADEKRPNINICPVCMAHPGSLPVINKEAVRHVLRVGKSLGAELADYTEFDRKSYFYPDIPKGYQLSQYAYPLVSGGMLRNINITRVHLEEDTARSQHVGETSLVDYNRAGVPLMELVTEPVIHSAEDAGAFARELQLLLRYLGASEANMEKGEMRVEANISVSRDKSLGTKVEVKNLNSFRSVERAIAFEVARHIEVLEKGGALVQETRGWNEETGATFSQRKKERAHDYRYFPDPDLPKLKLSEIAEFSHDTLEASLPELPWNKRARLSSLGFLQPQDIEQLVGDAELSAFFSHMEAELKEPELVKIAANFILNDIAGQRKKDPIWLPKETLLVEVVRGFAQGKLASPQAKASILSGELVETASASMIPQLVAKIVAAHPGPVAEYKAGKAATLQFLVGMAMRESKGSANPGALAEEFKKALS
ncbi:MAG TPA: Asp-tRNA(Asn)/Glu-tRNA(Gln) amidotransferase subunit GatB [Candidatus Paceibacterota bacterium]|nr:Asp-tRNA(Asn)/Glu-tRNA(Gln) amidotransferase subunit GatB [Candidatus Paceibacterota bacterium]